MPVQPRPAEPGEASGYVTIGGRPRGQPSREAGFELAGLVWPAFLAAGIGCLAVGVLLLVWPGATLVVAAILIGAALIVLGVLRLIHSCSASDANAGARVGSMVIGLLAIATGLDAIRHYHITIMTLAVLVGLLLVINGIAEVVAGVIGDRGVTRGLTVVAGVLSLAAGIIVLFWPTISLTILAAVLGIWLIVYGIVLLGSGLTMRRSATAAKKADEVGRFAAR
jgi:uncharacterized membrane protein HdeD (DUF308 family)